MLAFLACSCRSHHQVGAGAAAQAPPLAEGQTGTSGKAREGVATFAPPKLVPQGTKPSASHGGRAVGREERLRDSFEWCQHDQACSVEK